jgi:hypothetical protein
MRMKASSYFAVFILILMMVATASLLPMRNLEDKALPLVVAGGIVILTAVQLWRELHIKKDQHEVPEEKQANSGNNSRRLLISIGWVIGATLGVYLLGYLVGIVLFMFSFLRLNGQRWQTSASITAIVIALAYGIFEFVLGYELYRGLIYETIISIMG